MLYARCYLAPSCRYAFCIVPRLTLLCSRCPCLWHARWQLAQLERQREQLSIDAAAAWHEFLGEFAQHYDNYRVAVQVTAAVPSSILPRMGQGLMELGCLCWRTWRDVAWHVMDWGLCV